MEKAKAYIKNELRGGPLTQQQQQQLYHQQQQHQQLQQHRLQQISYQQNQENSRSANSTPGQTPLSIEQQQHQQQLHQSYLYHNNAMQQQQMQHHTSENSAYKPNHHMSSPVGYPSQQLHHPHQQQQQSQSSLISSQQQQQQQHHQSQPQQQHQQPHHIQHSMRTSPPQQQTHQQYQQQDAARCYVCGGPKGYEPIRVRPNPERPKEPFFPFIERHEPPAGVPQLPPNHHYVMVCTLCYMMLNEQWDAYERDGKPHIQRIYHMKRMDGKPFIGADMTTQGEYAAQMLGLSAEHLTQQSGGGSHINYNAFSQYPVTPQPGPPPPQRPTSRDYYQQQQQTIRNESPLRPTSRNESPHGKLDYYNSLKSGQPQHPSQGYSNSRPSSRNNNNNNNGIDPNISNKSQSRPQSRDHQSPQNVLPAPQQSPSPHHLQHQQAQLQQQQQQLQQQLHQQQQQQRVVNSYDGLNIKSSFAHHKLKLGQLPYMNSSVSPAANNNNNNNSNNPSSMQQPSSLTEQSNYQNQSLNNKYQQPQQQTQQHHSQQQQLQHSQQSHSYYGNQMVSPAPAPVTTGTTSNQTAPLVTSPPEDEGVLDLRNSSQHSSPRLLQHPTFQAQPQPPNPLATAPQIDVGILDLSMPDKNATTEVCYVCGEEQRRGSLIEIGTTEPKDKKSLQANRPYFPIFMEPHPRPPRSRPIDPRGMIQSCQLCYDHLVQQWNTYQANQTPQNARNYTLRKRPPPAVTERSSMTFVCYICGMDTISSQLRMVYCCPNAEREPYYPFIKSLKPFPNASPITQGMVQICSSCKEKHSNSAEGGNPNSGSSVTPSVGGGGSTSHHGGNGVINSTGGVSSNPGGVIGPPTTAGTGGGGGPGGGGTGGGTGGGRYTPSDKSQANSDSMSNVRFKPYETNNSNSSSSVRDLKTYRRDSRPNTPPSSISSSQQQIQGPVENGHGQYPCHICKTLCPVNKMEWLSVDVEHMNSHAMHFPFLKSNNDSSNRVLACKDCVKNLSQQWETMDAQRIPLEHRIYDIPSPSSINGSNRHGIGGIINTPPSTPSVSSSTPATSTSIYCFLCNLHSDFTLARILYASKEGSRPYFPFLLQHESPPNAEQLRPDKSALVCTFCYHALLNQWRKYEAQTPYINPAERTYNWHDYSCHLCRITTYRKRVRALPVSEFPFVKQRISDDGLLLENGEYAVVCLDCYETLRQQASQYDRVGVPISKRGYNWVPQPPPPEDSPDVSVARLPCGERSDKIQINSSLRPIPNKKNSSPKQFSNDKLRDNGKFDSKFSSITIFFVGKEF
ncbi:TPR-containing protein DDB_G0280363 isoform X2 [Condylostylus longicornis]|uniref:TPR-containing protein DDB_G0280363 isoform X2 n=1 Tax=Condylostylus longicornis TaxID=2530218 RepID=UPI00244E47F9|nr:TPR-containing protein DDB_G0280363 isoform X2 [Condylostylus longicornis]